ncbi:hypothetical protein M4I21_02805 [Cellulophaga sp. 20_2_10]|uniref:hypothetical protein n=1 Tax=Cellulophaga sp. 20_2_10 TaxID=2942476 RepID=UPI00201B2BBF|nr:hypothetical protein [Cellulophaga sp. 20_2_10]MCL5244722.1 hypothetical protein [Cellulophaga sp. 20_2_10]
MEDRNSLTFKGYLKVMSVMHLVFCVGILLFTIFLYLQQESWVFTFPISSPSIVIVPLIAITGIYLSNYVFKKKIEPILDKKSLKQKLGVYQSALIYKFAFVEGAAFVCLVFALSNSNLFYLSFTGLIIIYFITLRPTKDKIEQQLQLKGAQKEQFKREDDVIS